MVDCTQTMDNVIVVRSFSKGLGMAGIRLGYAITPKSMCKYMTRIILPFTPSIASVMIACSALSNANEFISKSVKKTKETKARMITELKKYGVQVLDTDCRTPIFMAYIEGMDITSWFEDRGILVESCHHFKETCEYMSKEYARVRIVGNDHDLEHFIYRLQAHTPKRTVDSKVLES